MAFTKDDREYIKGTIDDAITPVKDGLVRLEKQFDDHDKETVDIKTTQDKMLGAWNLCKYAIIPVAVALITWYITKG